MSWDMEACDLGRSPLHTGLGRRRQLRSDAGGARSGADFPFGRRTLHSGPFPFATDHMTPIAATEPAAAAVPSAPTGGPIRFLGSDRIYWRLLVRGAGLLLVTLGLYRFWFATDVRRYLWTHTEIADHTLEYNG